MSFAADELIGRSDEVIEAACDSEVILLRVETGRCYGLNAGAAHIWEKIVAPLAVSDLVTMLQAEFPGAAERCAAETLLFLEELAREGLVTRSKLA